MYNTGVAACEQLKELSFQGNIIPQIWYKVFVKQDLKRPKPHLLAINILADIVFWYRPREERDEATGSLTGYSKRFSSDLLQRSYDQLADLFGCSKGQATEAIVFLEKMGVVERVFRTRNIGGVICNNILYQKQLCVAGQNYFPDFLYDGLLFFQWVVRTGKNEKSPDWRKPE